MMVQRITHRRCFNNRRGMLTPMIAFALVVVMAAVALLLDRLWLDAAAVELVTCAEASALAAAGELANDDLLQTHFDSKRRITAARRAAVDVAYQNRVCGSPVTLDSSASGDVRFGRLVLDPETGETRFLETIHDPTSVMVTGRKTKSRNNRSCPIGETGAA